MASDKIKVLYLDDEEQNLHAFKASFRREFDIFTTTSAQDAVQHLNEHEVHVVISDQKMPDVSGVEFFEMIIPDFPDPARILLTGYSDLEAVIDAINKGQIFRYLTKPWDENDVRMSIKNGYDMWESRVELRERNQALQAANEELEQFVYSASHDLRAPLVSIKGLLRVAKQEPEANLPGYISLIERSINHLDGFVCDVIDYYQNRKTDVALEMCDLGALWSAVIDSVGGDHGLRGLQVSGAEALPSVLSDRLRWRMVFTNVLTNAVKFQDPAKSVSTLVIEVEERDSGWQIAFNDNGVGMSRQTVQQATDMFYRSDRQGEGAGLGLHIVKQAAEALGGTLKLQSQPGVGTSVSLSVPKPQAATDA